MNPATLPEAGGLFKSIEKSILQENAQDVILFVPTLFLNSLLHLTTGKIHLGCQAVHPGPTGAMTGCVSCSMLKSLSSPSSLSSANQQKGEITWCLTGHSERRSLYNESDEEINLQLHCILKNHMKSILCVGESHETYSKGSEEVKKFVRKQLSDCMKGISKDDIMNGNLVIAYEPIWSIGVNGVPCPPETANKILRFIREEITNTFDKETGATCRIMYGGRVTGDNVDALMNLQDIDGVLVGGGSLDAAVFERIINYKRGGV